MSFETKDLSDIGNTDLTDETDLTLIFCNNLATDFTNFHGLDPSV